MHFLQGWTLIKNFDVNICETLNNTKLKMVQVMAWLHTDDKPLSESMVTMLNEAILCY